MTGDRDQKQPLRFAPLDIDQKTLSEAKPSGGVWGEAPRSCLKAELDALMAERLSTSCRRRQKRTEIRDQLKQARDAGLIKRHASKSRRLNP